MQTTLKLMTRDGVLFMAFRPVLTPAQYAQLAELLGPLATDAELKQRIDAWATKQGLTVSFEE